MDNLAHGRAPGGARYLPVNTDSLCRGLPPARPGTLFALAERGGICVQPKAGPRVIFGRNEPEVHVCVGHGDPSVSRQHGVISHDGQRWNIRNTGHLPLRLPGSHLLLSGHQEPLATAYTPLFIRSDTGREHLLELRVAGTPPPTEAAANAANTRHDPAWELSETERLVAVVLAQRYLRHEAFPQPLPWHQVAEQLRALQPDQRWSAQRAEHLLARLHEQLTTHTDTRQTRTELGQPDGNTLNHNLITKLLLSTTLVPPDLRLLDTHQTHTPPH